MDHDLKLFAVYLGGSAPRSQTELHDVVFAVGATIDSTYEQLLDLWFGSPDGLQIDSWAELSIVDGHRITVSYEKPVSSERLFLVNMGAYVPGQLIEVHANVFYVSTEKKDALRRAKEHCLLGSHFLHRDYLYDVDECLEVAAVGKYFVHLHPTDEPSAFEPISAYRLIPRALVKAYKERTSLPHRTNR